MAKSRKKLKQSKPIWFVLFVLICLSLIVTVLLRGTDVALFNPKGFIAGEQHRLMIFVVAILLDLAIPTLFLFYYTAWKFRETNEKATYDPRTHHDKLLVFGIWIVPFIFMLLLASIMWPATHKLAPQKVVGNGAKPLTIRVIAMRWKWLFIYPDQNIATVNFVQIPTGTPVQFQITADETPMSSFWIPHLAGQLYAMTGHVNSLNLMADTKGDYAGSSAEINGSGFAGMKFIARASSVTDFDNWVQGVKQSPVLLDTVEYQKLLVPSEYDKSSFYSEVGYGIYDTMLTKYTGSHGQHTEHE